MPDSSPAELRVRPYEPRDRQAVRDLCCDTGYLGNPIDPVFEDRELFADFLTAYYTDQEPECCFVLEKDGVVKGYLLGARKRFKLQLSGLVPMLWSALRLLWRYPGYRPASRKYVKWLVTKGWRETPPAPKDAAHFHINILPEARTLDKTRELFNAFFEHLRAAGETRVYGQMSTFETRRGEALFKRYGFTVLNRGEITKYRDFTDQPIYLTTCVRELQPASDGENYTIRTRKHGK
jgi:ribosomal protein S18 acetylase RimI-like enzyme